MRAIRSILLSILLPLGALLLGLGMLAWGMTGAYESLLSTGWPTTPGRVVSAQVSKVTSMDNEITYAADIRYEYLVNGATLLGKRISVAGVSSSNRRDAEAVMARYPVGLTVRVSYNPKDPEQALLEPGFKAVLLLPLGVGLVSSLVGVFFAWRFIQNVQSGLFS